VEEKKNLYLHFFLEKILQKKKNIKQLRTPIMCLFFSVCISYLLLVKNKYKFRVEVLNLKL